MILKLKKLLTKILVELKGHDDDISALSSKVSFLSQSTYNFTGTKSNEWEYTGVNITVPNGYRYLVAARQTWTSGKPMGLAFHSNSTATIPAYGMLGEQISEIVVMLTAGTWYLYTYRGAVPVSNNSYYILSISFKG